MMEPQITDYYNEEPYMMKIIDNMNEELSESQKENQILKKKLKFLEGNSDRPFIKKTIITGEDIPKYLLIIKTIKEQLYNIMKNAMIEDESLNIRYIFDHEKDYIDILDNNLINVSREWCEYRIKNAMEKYVSLFYLNEYCCGDLINNDYLSDIIIKKIIDSIITGYSEDIYNYEIDYGNEPNLYDLCVVKCDLCNDYESYSNIIEGTNERFYCGYDCYEDCESDGYCDCESDSESE